jgi:thiamine biosynthesis protein ThiS
MKAMKILLNNRETTLEKETMTVSELLVAKNMTFRMRIVKINGELIEKKSYDSAIIRDGDNVQVIYLMSGG